MDQGVSDHRARPAVGRIWLVAALGAALTASALANAKPARGAGTAGSATGPTVIAKVTSRHPESKYRWYRSAVTVSFVCTPGASELTTPCPVAVTVTRTGRRITIRRTITNTTGQSATVVVRVNVDRTRPRLLADGVVDGRHYNTAPPLRCRAVDRVSGIASCRITRHAELSGDLTERLVHYRLTAVNRAGSSVTRVGSYWVAGV